MKIRTVYFKVSNMEKAIMFWSGFLSNEPHKRSQYWSEFKCSNINLGLLWTEDFTPGSDQCNFVPVFEFLDAQLEDQKDKALSLGAKVLVDIKNHPDKKSYVLIDPNGHEFEITRYHD